MRIENILIPVVVFAVVIGIGVDLYQNQNTNYEFDNADEGLFNAVDDRDDEIESDVTNLRGDTLGSDVSTDDNEGAFYKSGFPAVIGAFTAVGKISGIIGNMSSETGLIHSSISGGFLSILIILFASFVVYMIFRFKPPN